MAMTVATSCLLAAPPRRALCVVVSLCVLPTNTKLDEPVLIRNGRAEEPEGAEPEEEEEWGV